MTTEIPAYLDDLIAQMREELRGGPGVHHVDVFHDDDCAHWRGGVCDCRPDVRVRSEEPGASDCAKAYLDKR